MSERVRVSACLVTRGNVDMQPVIDSLPDEWEIIIYDNGANAVWIVDQADGVPDVLDLSVYGRYAAIEYASHDLIYVADDDVIVSDPQAIVDAWLMAVAETGERVKTDEGVNARLSRFDHLVANMPQEFRHDGYTDSCLVGFGACFHRDLPANIWERAKGTALEGLDLINPGLFNRTCDVVFTTLAPARVLVDVPKVNRGFASDPDRMWRQPGHVSERKAMLDLARQVRDAK